MKKSRLLIQTAFIIFITMFNKLKKIFMNKEKESLSVPENTNEEITSEEITSEEITSEEITSEAPAKKNKSKKQRQLVKGVIYKNGKAVNIEEPTNEGECLTEILKEVTGKTYVCQNNSGILNVICEGDIYETLVG